MDQQDGVLYAHDVTFRSDFTLDEFTVPPGLTVLHCGRENSATTLALTLAGRMRPKSGTIDYFEDGEVYSTPGQLHKRIAFAGVPEIDNLERLVPVWSIVREHIAWTSPWYKFTPRNLDDVEEFQHAAARIGFEMDNKTARETTIGDLGPLERLKLKIALALLSRPNAKLLIIDDIDQLRSLRLRADLLRSLKGLTEDMAVLAISANDDVDDIADRTIQIGGALTRAENTGPLHLVREKVKEGVKDVREELDR